MADRDGGATKEIQGRIERQTKLINSLQTAAAANTDADDDGGAGDENDSADWAATDPDANDGSANAAGAAIVFAADTDTDTEDGGSAGDDNTATADAANTDADDDGHANIAGAAVTAGSSAGDDDDSTGDDGGADWRSFFFKNKAYHLFLCMHDYFCYLHYCPSCW
ncbi:hypothetical protein RHMOL_Rhmol02G0027400 [Rhododendron molle]|uniref:Uncharacterized protein n=1 Tax=Rhododendron molle TaxID=49168 RepID=A0ACC0PMG1_RHOML|nr:hypothetical protein RHMOL_Rhmol02G0027400 [Rhododendron molle]